MDEIKGPYIEQQDAQDALYTCLQRRTLETVQRLSGKVWTDYNPHDPGVTLGEAANYALTEFDYKLGFPLVDYLADGSASFAPARLGLFPAAEVSAPSVVTVDDYRRLFLHDIPGIINLQMDFNPATNGYSICFVKMPFYDDEKVAKKIASLYQRNRNLSEWLMRVEPAEAETLSLEADIDIDPGSDATTVLANVYWCILQYLAGEGPDQKGRTEYELYKQLRKVEGVKYYRTCFLKKDGVPQSRFPDNATLAIPRDKADLKAINLLCGNTKVGVDIVLFQERLRGFCLSRRPRAEKRAAPRKTLTASRHEIYTHSPISGDLPDCYRLAPRDADNSFGVYVSFYDWIIATGLAEAEELPQLLSVAQENFHYSGRTARLKSTYLDFLDALYGVDSHPSWLQEENCYGETPEEAVRRRMAFLRRAPLLQRNRARGRDLSVADGQRNSPTVKEWFCLLLGLDPGDGHYVCNVLPANNLRLFEIGADGRHQDRIDSFLIDEAMMQAENVLSVEFIELSVERKGKVVEYDEIRLSLPFFHENLISGDLFRNGTNLKNYKIVRIVGGEYMLLFRHKEYEGWTNLGHSTDVHRLVRLANILRRYLLELNRASETMYLLEPVLGDSSRPFEVDVVLPAWTFRFHRPRFREESRKLLRSLLPAHLGGKVYWISEAGMRKFELLYQQYMVSFSDRNVAKYRKALLDTIYDVLENAEEIQDLNDAD